ncbi:MAG: copper homeostasis protein CutC [Devosiaceae bacterium]|nr:copper homeostasis protein CutC [Devosiaceae bacterium MH13]
MTLLEVCVDTLEGAHAAVQGGAGRIELCSSLSEGGLTPSAGLMRAAVRLPVPVYAMIRPRSGLFAFSRDELAIMLDDIAAARAAGLAGVVLGVQDATGGLDDDVLAQLVGAAGDMGKTLHRVIDVVPDPLAALDQAIALGFDRVLTSGAQPLAPDGAELIAAMVTRAAGRLNVMPGCGLLPENVAQVVAKTGASEVHAACQRRVPGDPAFSDFDPPGGRFETSAEEVSRMVTALGG